MASAVLQQEVDTLREYMKELSYQAMRCGVLVMGIADETMQVINPEAVADPGPRSPGTTINGVKDRGPEE